MKDLKIRVTTEAESKEAQELFFKLGYYWAYKNLGKNSFYQKMKITYLQSQTEHWELARIKTKYSSRIGAGKKSPYKNFATWLTL